MTEPPADHWGPWTLTALTGPCPAGLAGRVVPATVPGTVHTDLLAAGLIPDPYLDANETELTWIGRTSWRYETTLTTAAARPGEHVDLVFEGLDTVCQVQLNGVRLGVARNMHRTHRFDASGVLRAGSNSVAVIFEAQLDAAEQASLDLGHRVHVNAHPFNAIRKMACNFGWDWGPDLVTAGIWRPVRLERWRGARFGAVRCLATVAADATGADGMEHRRGLVELHADLVRAAPKGAAGTPEEAGTPADDATALTLIADVGGHTVTVPAAAGENVVAVELPDAQLWWPRGYGDQPLYEATLTLRDAAGVTLDRWSRRIGLRSIELRTERDEYGRGFVLAVNGCPILVKGANWIPDDCFVHRVDRTRYASRIGQAQAAGINLLRVWGGGIYESEDFYELCDQQGLLVWQDFLFACAGYSEEEPLRGEVIAEATEAIVRLSSHPSLAVWNGCNENLWGHRDWQWIPQLGELTWGAGYYFDLLPQLVARLDPTRPYSPGSPWSFDAPEPPDNVPPNDPSHGTTHLWRIWNELDYTHYRDAVPRFVAEFGYQGPPSWTTLRRSVHDDPLTPVSAQMRIHQKAAHGDSLLSRGLRPHLDEPSGFEDWHWAMSLQQARAVRFGIEHFRSWHPVCAGMIVWQLNDCWPVVSWSAIDSDGRKKPLWYALRQAYAGRLMTIQPRPEGLTLVLGNDTDEHWAAIVELRRESFGGVRRADSRIECDVAARSTRGLVLPPVLLDGVAASDEVLVAEAGNVRALWFFAEDRDLRLRPEWVSARVAETATGYAVRLTAASLQRDVSLLADKEHPDAVVDDMLVTVLAGETHTFQVRMPHIRDPERLLRPAVLRSANQLVAGDRDPAAHSSPPATIPIVAPGDRTNFSPPATLPKEQTDDLS